MNIDISPELQEARNQKFLVTASCGGDNAFYLGHCGVVDHRPPYAMCLKHIADRKEGRLDPRWAACSAAVGNKTCAALKLRKEEIAADQALYFVPRSRVQEMAAERDSASNERFARIAAGGKRSGGKPQRKAAEPKQESIGAAIGEANCFAEAITRAVAVSTAIEKPVAPKKETPEIKPPTGGGLMALARARKAQQ